MTVTKPADSLKLYNHDAEITVLSAMRQDESFAIHMAKQLTAADFHDVQRQLIFDSIVRLIRGIEPLNDENILAESRGVAMERKTKPTIHISAELLATLNRPTTDAVRSAITLHRLAWLRKAGDYTFWLAQALQSNPDPLEIYAEAQERWQVLSPPKSDGVTLYGWDTTKFGSEVATRRKQEAEIGLIRRFDWPESWHSWNKKDGVRPMRPGLVGVLAAPDGCGKSTYLDWIAEHWAKNGNKTVLVHLEDDHEYKLDRRKARYSKVPLSDIEDSTLTAQQESDIEKSEKEVSEWAGNLHYTHTPGWSMSKILAEVQKLIDEGQCDCLVLDYIDKCEADDRQLKLFGSGNSSVYLRQGNDMNQLKNFAEHAQIPVFTATQGNKGMQDQGRVQTRQDIEGSGQKSQRAQLVIILTRDIVGPEGLRDENGQKIAEPGDYSPISRLRIDKQNRGKTGTFFQIFRGDCFRIGDPPVGWKPTS